ncbi:hypothetical protein A2954_05665 [Candidatus Roizmanbacteria bacterium RIFCSPLOWO2_01_FULL_37_12]|uniref:Glycosyltransferase 2-like domain-containing protein n=1 Tax=Candidatus Roizmanbacteria bacterium RIFCSPLOWO2_01_FULL_37_12 TaxID=1802056 RepID=A0A1F7IBQ9_9BACT|nr:MAG: hypothetical protein A2768_02405 [Candidatus Roizmanbacteria bacterium RIFCSPHIGHO2_01_FULL_37_16]OGK24921.1 MAG: hypothetical protein A3D76_02820 [Candidatus Roizmanbacteria bacterium RIFCSPHIGHO2_02_FULL_37_9b]OGK40796.1 MAG: hypothetical protein A2954_05665 [Candidatus Roizmanbacteria bacterium RIFCSPLOWO2_01_FULL_37_12]
MTSRLFDAIVPVLSWIVITMPVWLSPFHPAVAAYFIITFDLYFLYKSLTTTYFATLAYKYLLIHLKIPYAKKLKKLRGAEYIQHYVIIPNYKEPLYKLESTIQSLVNSDYPFKNISLVLAFEQRESEARDKALTLQKKFRENFDNVITTFHPLLPQEESGKASNQTFAAKEVDTFVEKNKMVREKILITICDADSSLAKNYFSYLTYEYLRDRERLFHFYWAPVLLYNNFWRLPLFIRIQATLSSILRLAFLPQKDKLIQISTYSTSLWLLKKINFWDVDIIPEDWHIFYQAFFSFGEKIKTIPLYTITNGDAVYSGGLLKTSGSRYEQEKRWAWGVSDISYTLKKFISTPHINPFVKLRRILFLAETHLLWTVSFFILTISASVPPLINPIFKRTVLGFLLPKLSGIILTLASLMLILYVYLDYQLRKKLDHKIRLRSIPFLFIQWYLLPIVSFIFSSLPALDAHTRLLFGKKIKYKVTEKI